MARIVQRNTLWLQLKKGKKKEDIICIIRRQVENSDTMTIKTDKTKRKKQKKNERGIYLKKWDMIINEYKGTYPTGVILFL